MFAPIFRYFSPTKKYWEKNVSFSVDTTERPELYPDLKELIAIKDRKAHLKISAERSIKSTIPGDHHSPYRGQGLEFDAVREYVPGDDVRNIDWRVTARLGTPHLKLFQEEREREVIFCVDMNAEMRFGTRKTFKSIQAARVAAFLGWRALEENDRVGACLFGDVPQRMQFFAAKRTRKSLWSMLKLMASSPKEHHQVSLEESLRHIYLAAKTGALIYVISDFRDVTSGLEEILTKLNKNCDVICIAISDIADKLIPPIGNLEFQSMHSEKIAINTESLQGRENYKAQWEENRKQLSTTMTRAKISMIELTTEMDIYRELILGMRTLAKRRI